MTSDARGTSLIELFREEARTQAQVLDDGLLRLERLPRDPEALESCMRAAHSLKGAARIVDVQLGVELSHVMEECFVAAQEGRLLFDATWADLLLHAADLVRQIGEDETPGFEDAVRTCIATLQAQMNEGSARRSVPNARPLPPLPPMPSLPSLLLTEPEPVVGEPLIAPVAPPAVVAPASEVAPASTENAAAEATLEPAPASEAQAQEADRMLRIRADSLDRLLSLSGESMVESRWLKPFAQSMLRIKRVQRQSARSLQQLTEKLDQLALDPSARVMLDEVRRLAAESQQMLGERLSELETFDQRSTHLSQQLYDAALQCRMRPFGDGTSGFARMVRDVARSLGKRVRWQLVGESTQVDRDILDMLEAPIGHMLRNAIDHGIETPDVRVANGKREEGTITLDARHSAGHLLVSVSDDGGGIDLAALRRRIVQRKLVSEQTAGQLSEQELLEFLFLPGFSMREQVTDVSGRGVGLDAVHDVVKRVRGTIRVTQEPGVGTRMQMQLPLTLSVVRSLLVEVAGEPYAIPLAHVQRTLHVPGSEIGVLEGHQHIAFDGRRIGIVTARQILGTPDAARAADTDQANVIVIGGGDRPYGVVVDRFIGERTLVVQRLDARLGKIRNVMAGALMENGDPVLIADVDDWIRSVERLVASGKIRHARSGDVQNAQRARRRVLVVDDSLTVRELERKLLAKRGYDVTTAVDGMDGWNTVRTGGFDLVVTDIDMPRMDGIELVTMIKNDPVLHGTPVMIVSYKDREEDRQAGLRAGADYYLAKGSFQDDALLDAVQDLIGEAYA